MNKVKKSDADKLLVELQAIDFALVDITLYLDTHPDDEIAFAQHKELAEKRQDIRHQIVVLDGPQNAYEVGDSAKWQWSEGPWPWQI